MAKDGNVISAAADMLASYGNSDSTVALASIAKAVGRKEEDVEDILASSGFFAISTSEIRVRKIFWYENVTVKVASFSREGELAKAYLRNPRKAIATASGSKVLAERVLVVAMKNQIACLSERFQETIVNSYQPPRISRETLYSKHLPGELAKYETDGREAVSIPKKWLTARLPEGLEFKFDNGLEANSILSWLKSVQLAEPEVVLHHLVNHDFEAWLRTNANWSELANILASLSRKCSEENIGAEDAKALLISYLRRTPAEGLIYEHTIRPLIKRLESGDEQTLIESAHKLALIGDERAVDALIGRLIDSSARARCAIMRALGKIGDVSATPFILKVLKNSSSRDDRLSALAALGMLRDERAVDALLDCLSDMDEGVALEALSALGEVGSARALPRLREIANGESELAKRAGEVIRTHFR